MSSKRISSSSDISSRDSNLGASFAAVLCATSQSAATQSDESVAGPPLGSDEGAGQQSQAAEYRGLSTLILSHSSTLTHFRLQSSGENGEWEEIMWWLNEIFPYLILTSQVSGQESILLLKQQICRPLHCPHSISLQYTFSINHLKSEKKLSIIFLIKHFSTLVLWFYLLPLMPISLYSQSEKKSSEWWLGQCWHLQQIFEVLILVTKCQGIQSNEANPGSH